MYRLARLSLANRAVVALLTIAIAVFGWISLGSLKQELIPSLQIPTAVVVAVDPGSSPQLVEQQVTVPVEQAVRAVDGVEKVTSTSSTGLSTTTVELTYGGDLDASAQALQQAVDRVRTSLPSGVEPTVFTGLARRLPRGAAGDLRRRGHVRRRAGDARAGHRGAALRADRRRP